MGRSRVAVWVVVHDRRNEAADAVRDFLDRVARLASGSSSFELASHSNRRADDAVCAAPSHRLQGGWGARQVHELRYTASLIESVARGRADRRNTSALRADEQLRSLRRDTSLPSRSEMSYLQQQIMSLGGADARDVAHTGRQAHADTRRRVSA